MQDFQSGMSWFMFTCVHVTSVLILKCMRIDSCTVVCANQIVLKLRLAEPDLMCGLASLLMCCTVHLCGCAQTQSCLYTLQFVSVTILGAGRFSNHGLLRKNS